MKRPARLASISSSVPVDGETPTPRDLVLDKTQVDDPFSTFSEWATPADEKAYGAL